MSEIVPTCREDVTKRILQQKVALQKKWRDLAIEINQRVEWYGNLTYLQIFHNKNQKNSRTRNVEQIKNQAFIARNKEQTNRKCRKFNPTIIINSLIIFRFDVIFVVVVVVVLIQDGGRMLGTNANDRRTSANGRHILSIKCSRLPLAANYTIQKPVERFDSVGSFVVSLTRGRIE